MGVPQAAHALRVRRRWLALVCGLLAAHLAASWLWLVPGHLSIDECTYHLMVKNLAERGSLAFWNGYEELASEELVLVSVEPHEGRLFPVTPALYAVLALPFYGLAGYTGLFLLNNLAFLAVLALTAALAWRLFRDPGLALGATLVLALGTYLWEYSQATWPHALSTLAVLAAMAAALRGLEVDSDAAAFGRCLLAGLLVGVGVGVRLDVALTAPCLAVPYLFASRRRMRAALGLPLGALPPLCVLSFMNHSKFGTWSPLSYGPRVSAAGDWSAYLPVAALGLALLAVCWAAQRPEAQRLLRERPALLLGAAALLLGGLLLAPEPRALLLRLGRGGWQVLVDLRLHDPLATRPALSRSAGGGLVYFGHLKKSLLQSCPYLVVLAVPLAAMLRGHAQRGPLAALFLVPAAFAAAFSYFAWDGGMGLNLRYLAPVLPFTSILTAWALRELFRGVRGLREPAVWIGAWLGAAAWLVLARPRSVSVDEAELPYLDLPLALAGVTLALVLALLVRKVRARDWLRTAARAAVVSGLVWAGLVAFRYDFPAARWLRGYNAELSRMAADVVEADSILFTTHPDPFCGLFEARRVRLALPRRDRFRDFRRLVDFHRGRGRAVYGAFPPDLWSVIERRAWLDALAVETLWEHPVFTLARIGDAD
jgi:hypothetical protein